MRITIQGVDGPNTPPGKKYQVYEVTYTDLKDNNNRVKKVMSFGNEKAVFDQLDSGVFGSGSTAEVTLTKDGKFWNWTGLRLDTGGGAATSPNKAISSEPRVYVSDKEKNESIGRQNALTNAIKYFEVNVPPGTAVPTEEILGVAEEFYNWTSQGFAYRAEDLMVKLDPRIPAVPAIK